MDGDATETDDGIVFGDGVPAVLLGIPIFGRLLYDFAIASCVETGVQAIYMVLIGMSTWSSVTRIWTNLRQYRTPLRPRPTFIIGPCVMLAATLAMFTIATFMWSMDLATYFYMFRQLFLADYPSDITIDQFLDKANHLDVNVRASVAQEPLFFVQYLIGDALVIWRAVTLHRRVSDRRWLIFVLCLIWLAVAGTGVGQISCSYADPGTFQGDDPSFQSCQYILSKTSWALSLFLNIVATILLLFTLRIWRVTVQPVITNSKTGYILKFIFMSGIVYVTMGILKLCLNVSDEISGSSSFADDDAYDQQSHRRLFTLAAIVDSIMPHLVGMYPTLIMVFVRFEISKDPSSSEPTHSTAVARGLASHPGANVGQSFGFTNISSANSPKESMTEVYAGKTLVVGPHSPETTTLPDRYFTPEDRTPHASPLR